MSFPAMPLLRRISITSAQLNSPKFLLRSDLHRTRNGKIRQPAVVSKFLIASSMSKWWFPLSIRQPSRQWISLVPRSHFLLAAWSTLHTNTLRTSWAESGVRFAHERLWALVSFFICTEAHRHFLANRYHIALFTKSLVFFFFFAEQILIEYSHTFVIQNAWSHPLHVECPTIQICPIFDDLRSQIYAHHAKFSLGHHPLFHARSHFLLDARKPVLSGLHPCARRPSQQNCVESFIWFLSVWYSTFLEYYEKFRHNLVDVAAFAEVPTKVTTKKTEKWLRSTFILLSDMTSNSKEAFVSISAMWCFVFTYRSENDRSGFVLSTNRSKSICSSVEKWRTCKVLPLITIFITASFFSKNNTCARWLSCGALGGAWWVTENCCSFVFE